MNENETMNEQQETMTPEETLEKLMQNSVPKEKYDALQQKYNSFFSEVANGHFGTEKEDEAPSEEDKRKKFEEALRKLYERKTHGSAEFFENALIVDDYLVEHGHRSGFVESMGDVSPESESNGEAFKEILRESLDVSGGNSYLCSANFADCIDTKIVTGSRS